MSYNVFPCNKVPFGGLVHTAPHFVGQISQKTFYGVGIGIFKPNVHKIKSYCNQILHRDKDHQILLAGVPNTRDTNPRWRTDAIFKKYKNGYVSATI